MKNWGLRKELRWCPYCNIPLRGDSCSKCGSRGFRIPLHEPGDVRPAFSGDLKLIEEAVRNEFGDDKLVDALGLRESLFLLNKTAHYDEMKEVIIGGAKVGKVFFDPVRGSWRWRLNAFSGLVAAEMGYVAVKKVSGKVKPLEFLGPCREEDSQALIVNSGGRPVALAVCRSGKFRVQSIFRSDAREPLKKRFTLGDVFRGNSEYLASLISKGIKLVSIMSERVRKPVVLSYSGGKDSLVALHLTLRAGIEPYLLFNDTGLEYPTTYENVELVGNLYGLELLEAEARGKFWEAAKFFGPPARDYRWCCKIIKLAPISRELKKRFNGEVLSIVAQRALESVDRSHSGRVWRNRWIPSVLNVTPVHEWDQLMEWLYVLKEGLPVNELYFKGFDRLGCYLCPAGSLGEFCLIERFFPELWLKWVGFLREWAREKSLSEAWLKYHLWRWRRRSAQGRRRIESWTSVKSELPPKPKYSLREVVLKDDYVSFKLTPPISSRALTSQVSVLDRDANWVVEESLLRVTIRGGEALVGEDGEVIIRSSNALEIATLIVELAIRWEECVGCRSCETWCPKNAITVAQGKPKVDSRRCITCRVCVEVCPISELYVKKEVLPTELTHHLRGRHTSSLNILEAVKVKAIMRRKGKTSGSERILSYGSSDSLKSFVEKYLLGG